MKKAEVLLAGQVKDFLAALAPDPKKKLRAGLHALRDEYTRAIALAPL